jgi:hypothetical protein
VSRALQPPSPHPFVGLSGRRHTLARAAWRRADRGRASARKALGRIVDSDRRAPLWCGILRGW